MIKILLTEKQADILHDSIVAYQLNDNEREVDETLNKVLDKILKAKRARSATDDVHSFSGHSRAEHPFQERTDKGTLSDRIAELYLIGKYGTEPNRGYSTWVEYIRAHGQENDEFYKDTLRDSGWCGSLRVAMRLADAILQAEGK